MSGVANMLNVVCLKWGDKYSSEYVNRLYNMVNRNLNVPFVFHCITENSEGIFSTINILSLPDLGLKGWWYKLSIFQEDFYGLSGQILFLDLDIVITNDITKLVNYSPNKLCISQDQKIGRYNSSVMCFKIGSFAYIWNSFWQQREKVIESYHGDQDWIERVCISAEVYPKPLIVSFKYDCDSRAKFAGGALGKHLRRIGWFRPKKYAKLPKNTSVVLFHGKPDPEDVIHGSYDKYRCAPWILEYWR